MPATRRLTLIVLAMICSITAFDAVQSHAAVQLDLQKEVAAIANLIKKGNSAGAKNQAAATAKKIDDLADLMELFRPKVGPFPAGFPKNIPVNAAEDVGYKVAAMAELSHAKAPITKDGAAGKTKKAWADYSKAMQDAGLEIAKAGAKNDKKGVAAANTKLENTCNACHATFK